jgi:dTDP-4-dehydrorhamnose 3,5-epimerase
VGSSRHGFNTLSDDNQNVYTDFWGVDAGFVLSVGTAAASTNTDVTPVLSAKDEAAPTLADFDSPFTF